MKKEIAPPSAKSGALSLPDKQLFVKGDTAIESDNGFNEPMLFLKDDLGNDLVVVHASKNSQNGRGNLGFSTFPIPGVVKERMKLTGNGKLAVSLGGDPQETIDVGGNVRAIGNPGRGASYTAHPCNQTSIEPGYSSSSSSSALAFWRSAVSKPSVNQP